jgi:hypothetical protein
MARVGVWREQFIPLGLLELVRDATHNTKQG